MTTPEITYVTVLTCKPIKGFLRHSGETRTHFTSAIHRCLSPHLFLRGGGICTQANLIWSDSGFFYAYNCLHVHVTCSTVLSDDLLTCLVRLTHKIVLKLVDCGIVFLSLIAKQCPNYPRCCFLCEHFAPHIGKN